MSVGDEEVLPTDFGKYRLVKKIATGGMAEIFLAHRHSAPLEPIVIKRILPHLIKGGEFVSMFLDEARIAAQLHHENIVQIFDVGQIEGAYFIAMEYVHGEDIRRIYNAAYRLQRSLPLSHSIRVIADAALGLGHAHKLSDLAGRPLGVVHRDVSPQNILVTYEGGVKVVDFGIAKAANKVNETRAGVLKGKYSYMSPEQALGDTIDHRTDIFALGIILYETTTGTRLFKRHNELATLQAIIKCEIIPPSEALAGYPPDLEKILLKSLAKNPDDRYGDASEFSRVLYDFLHSSELYVEREVIADFMADLFKDRLEEERGSGEPALPDEDEVKEEMKDSTTPMKGGATPSNPYDTGDNSGDADTRLKKTTAQKRPRRDPDGTDLGGSVSEADPDAGFGNGAFVGDATTNDVRPPTMRSSIRATAADKASSVVTTSPPSPADIPSTMLGAKARANRQPTDVIRPSEEEIAAKPNGRADPEATEASGDIPKGDTEARPPADMLPTIAAQPIYEAPEKSEMSRARQEPTEQVRLRDLRDKDRVRERDRDRATDPSKSHDGPERAVRAVGRRAQASRRAGTDKRLLARVMLAVAAVLAAVLAGILASRLVGHVMDKNIEVVETDGFGRVTVLTEPGAEVFAGGVRLGAANGEGVAGPFRVKGGDQVLKVAIQDAGFERERKVKIQADRIHEFEIRGRKGFLRVQVQPWARVRIDAHDVGITPLAPVPLLEGSHKITLENPESKRRFATDVRIEPGLTNDLKVNLLEVGESM